MRTVRSRSHGASRPVGGSAPILETLRREVRRGAIRSIAGVLNGTCNYVLDRCMQGVHWNTAVREAHERGFAEADAVEDLSGNDSARRLRILAQHAFGQELAGLAVEPLTIPMFLRMRVALNADERLCFVARAWKLGTRVLGQVRLEAVARDDPFAQVHGEWNRLIITREDGAEVVISGRGAGRWPTTESVIADLLELARTMQGREA